MNISIRVAITWLAGLALAGLIVGGPAVSQSAKGVVILQPSSPGTAQVGHANLTGSIQAGRLLGAATGSSSGVVGSHTTNTGQGFLGGPTAAVYGSQGTAQYAGRFDGTVSVNGQTLIASSASPALEVNGFARLAPSTGLPLSATSSNVNAISARTRASDDFPAIYGLVEAGSATNAGVWGNNLVSDTQGFLAFGQAGVKGTGLWGGYFEGMGFFSQNVGIGVSGPDAGLHVVKNGEVGVFADTTTQAALFGYSWQVDGVVGGAAQPIVSGVYGYNNNGGGYGVFSGGTLGSSGTKTFVIDHPLDPENKMLRHYCSEGPEPLNVYRGTVTTDSEGLATVTMPDYYDAINLEPTYQLTVVSEEGFPQAKVQRKLYKGQFVIRTSEPHVEVCWRVEARRNDRFVREYGAPVEVDKGVKRGRYLSPELYDQPQSKSIHSTDKPRAKNIPAPVFGNPKVASQ